MREPPPVDLLVGRAPSPEPVDLMLDPVPSAEALGELTAAPMATLCQVRTGSDSGLRVTPRRGRQMNIPGSSFFQRSRKYSGVPVMTTKRFGRQSASGWVVSGT